MKWGGIRKPSSSSSSSSKPSFMPHVSPFSWLSKFKQMKTNSEPKPGETLKKTSPSHTSSPHYASGDRGRFYAGDDDAFWRLSFGEGSTYQHKKNEDTLKPIMYNLDAEHDLHDIPSPSFHSGRLNTKRHGTKEGTLKLKRREIGLREERKLLNEAKSLKELEHLRKRYERKAQRVLQEQLLKLAIAQEEAEFASKECLENDSPRTIWTPRKHSFSADSKSYGLGSINKSKQTEEFQAKVNSKQRQSVHVSREVQRRKPKQNSKVKVYSPRMGSKVEIRKIKAIEEKKKAKLKMKKEEEVVEEKKTRLDSFAVVKCSLDPQQDFRDSMIEMITEKQISHPEEMEELLACYLTLNSNEYHDLIIKVFKQVWLCMSQASLGVQSYKQCCCCD